ncbi:spindle poly body spacer protein [Purpureocillium lavendulum]|uniref:Spindle poly body spacer protein n=1 Tax=Purpureocillium lavendulum TaxID=1247861 RepID=A0AB34FNH1_9HYPO|nr:spindle poly body spacer protein [Purpureocillium lavendulum]
MFGFFKSDTRASEKKAATPTPKPNHPQTVVPIPRPAASLVGVSVSKRSRDCVDDSDASLEGAVPAKRARAGSTSSPSEEPDSSCDSSSSASTDLPGTLDQAHDIIEHQFGLEVLLKHNELRLINQELAKCQVALEQLRRCHLIPYPQSYPTPDQMLDISSGKGPALASRSGEPIPRWAPPFGVVDGPYARHYAKWLIPDPSFDGIQPEWQFTAEYARGRGSVTEGRTTRNSFTEPSITGKGRPMRGIGGQKLQALSNGYPQTKDKAGPCVLKRSDGQTVKLVCLDCNRENFSSTQGFINHCRIAHKRDFKSHEEAAMQSGQPIDVVEPSTSAAEDKTPTPASSTAFVHPLARQDMSEQEAYVALRSRIQESLKLYHAGKLPGVDRIPSSRHAQPAPRAQTAKPSKFAAASEAPYLSRLMNSRNFGGSLHDLVADAKTKVSFEDITPDEDSDESESSPYGFPGALGASAARTPVVMRVPAGSGKSTAVNAASGRPTSSKGRHPDTHLMSPKNDSMMPKGGSTAVLSDEDIDMDDANLSPNTLISNNAPSLVSDDGEYDDSDEGSSVSGSSDNLEDASMSDVAEITLDDDHEPRSLRRGSNGVAGPVKLRKDDPKHVTFMSPVKNTTKQRRTRRV